MMRVILFLLALLLLGGCTTRSSAPDTFADLDVPSPQSVAGQPEKDRLPDFSGMRVMQAETGRLTPEGESTVTYYGDFGEGETLYHTPYLVIETGGETFYRLLDEEGSYGTPFWLADIDGDGLDEIGMSYYMPGYTGPPTNTVYKFEEGGLSELFTDNHEESEYDSGFRMTLADGLVHNVTNEFTGYAISFCRQAASYAEGFGPGYFDPQGNLLPGVAAGDVDIVFYTSRFDRFEAVDMDGDGVYEILTKQNAYLNNQHDFVGIACAVLKWDGEARTMAAVKTAFYPDGDRYDDNWWE